jgi:nicotinamidase-related amidase
MNWFEAAIGIQLQATEGRMRRSEGVAQMTGATDLQLPEELRDPVNKHLEFLREGFERRHYGGRVGFGERPALIVVDLAEAWTDPNRVLGSSLDSVVDNTVTVLTAARSAGIPIFFSVVAFGPDDPETAWDIKQPGRRQDLAADTDAVRLDGRLERQTTEKLIVKKYGSCFKGTDLNEMLAWLDIDTLIVTGCSTYHCVYATCKDAASNFRVIVPREAVGDRCELFHAVALLDIDLSLGDVLPVSQVVDSLQELAVREAGA